MTERVDFYVLKRGDARQRKLFACRLTEKAYLKNLKVLVLADNDAEAREFDDLLWTFSDGSFVPHQLRKSGEDADPLTPVQIGLDAALNGTPDLVLNLGTHQADSLVRFARIAEIIDDDENRRRLGRERFKTYRERQVALETHTVEE